MPKNPHRLTFRVSDAELAAFESLARTFGLRKVDVLRKLVASKVDQLRAAAALDEPPPPPALVPDAPPGDGFLVDADAFDPAFLAWFERQQAERQAAEQAARVAEAQALLGLAPPPLVVADYESARCPTCRCIVPLGERHLCIGCPRCRKPITFGVAHTCTGFVFP